MSILSNDSKQDFLVYFENKKYEIKRFLKKHPGGVKILENYEGKSITKIFRFSEHSDAAKYLLQEYRIVENESGKVKISDGNSDSRQSEIEEIENLESVVDWSKPMISQVPKLGSNYIKWVNMPVDRKVILFENSVLEALTYTTWFTIPLVWIPVILYYFRKGCDKYFSYTHNAGISSCIYLLLYVLFGVLLWSMLEYSLHRWLFHMNISGRSEQMIKLHFILHGVHHKAPFDSGRLVFPPFASIIVSLILTYLYEMIFSDDKVNLIICGSVTGYLMYDMIHFYLHNGSPNKDSYFYNMKRYHYQHHFVHYNNGFGISSQFWDLIFNTKIILKKLNKSLKW